MTAYVYDTSDQEMLNVGWLAPDCAYLTGIVDDRVIDAMKALSSAYDNQTRGVHQCEFCSTERPVVLGGPTFDTQVWLGSAEIRAQDTDGTVYAAPNLVIHYITEHRYCPRYLLRGPATGPLASGPGMTVSPCRSDDLGGGVTGPGRCRRRR